MFRALEEETLGTDGGEPGQHVAFTADCNDEFSKAEDELFQILWEMNEGSKSGDNKEEDRSRHGSTNSIMSYDSAIGDIYCVQTPKGSSTSSSSSSSSSSDWDSLGSPGRKGSSEKWMNYRKDVEGVCVDLLRRFQDAVEDGSGHSLIRGEDPLLTTIQLLTDSLYRLRHFLLSLDPVIWLHESDRDILYNAHVCTLSILKASMGSELSKAPSAYPLPYGEYLGEIEALHLILAHDLYNELRSLLAHVQELEIRELPVMLLVMMIAFFTPATGRALHEPEKVIKVHDYYVHKLQIYLKLKHGFRVCPLVMSSIVNTIDKVRNFSERFREFLKDVTRCGLQKQYESVCENIGLMAFLLQFDPIVEIVPK